MSHRRDANSPRPDREASAGPLASPSPIDFVYRYQPNRPKPFFAPRDWQEAVDYLRKGNQKIIHFYEACKQHGYPSGLTSQVVDLSALEAEGNPKGEDGLPVQMPYAVIVGCADARVPTEILFGQEFNDLFNIRVAGNVLAKECVGSLLYALTNFVPESPTRPRNLKLVVALGHRGCGAVRATIRAFERGALDSPWADDPIGSILHRIAIPSVFIGAEAFDEIHGAGAAVDPANLLPMVELVVYLNAAWVAHDLRAWVDRQGSEIADNVGVVYGVFDPNDLRIRSKPHDKSEETLLSQFGPPPSNLEELRALAIEIVAGLRIPATP